ncbi:hypothetical protein [Niastella sp. OAS944]|uniref:hypothetical protein n=1 Tax=Niastella sp. OAS944 TaxID=2664089 RepID=UPI00347D0F2E|nr:hypothetical protein [Chitinophagaceae bacterium OAS944]
MGSKKCVGNSEKELGSSYIALANPENELGNSHNALGHSKMSYEKQNLRWATQKKS